MLAQNSAPPPALEMPPDSLGGTAFAVTSLRFVDTRSAAGAITQGMVAAGIGLRGGTGGSIDGYASYASSDDAQRGYEALQRECANKPDSCFFSPGLFGDARADVDCVVAVHQYLGFNDWHQTLFLADRRKTRQGMRIRCDGR